MIKNQHSIKVIMRSIEVFVKTGKFIEVKRQVGVHDVPRIIFKGLKHLDTKYNLSLDKDRDSSIGYILNPATKEKLLPIVEKEIKNGDNDIEVLEPKEVSNEVKNKALELIAELHQERMVFKVAFEKVNSKILELEKLLKSID